MSGNTFDQLVELLARFPGVGPRQAKRFVYFLLGASESSTKELVEGILALKKRFSQCQQCFRYFERGTGNAFCNLCIDPERDHSMLMVVARDIDLENVRKSGTYTGGFFVLGGTVPVLGDKETKRLRTTELKKMIQSERGALIQEIIIALPANPDGDTTAGFVRSELEPIIKKKNVVCTVLGRGLSTGTELEYSDADTIRSALKNRS